MRHAGRRRVLVGVSGAPGPDVTPMHGFSLGINVDRPEQVDEITAAARKPAAVTKGPSKPTELAQRHAASSVVRITGVVYPRGRFHAPGNRSRVVGKRA